MCVATWGHVVTTCHVRVALQQHHSTRLGLAAVELEGHQLAANSSAGCSAAVIATAKAVCVLCAEHSTVLLVSKSPTLVFLSQLDDSSASGCDRHQDEVYTWPVLSQF